MGDPRHGEFAYRCSNRCKRYPGIKESFLNDTVWNAIRQWLERPDVVEAGVKGSIRYDRMQMESSAEHDRRALEQIQQEETRIVQGYRLGVLTSDQLDTELRGLRARRALIRSTRPSVKVGIDDIRQSLTDYRRHISDRLELLSQEQRRDILQHLVAKIVFEGERVRITGKVAISAGEGAARISEPHEDVALQMTDAPRDVEDLPEGSIAGTTSWNHALKSPSPLWSNEAKSTEATFEVVAIVLRDRTAMIAASRANLLKAKAVRWKRDVRGDRLH